MAAKDAYAIPSPRRPGAPGGLGFFARRDGWKRFSESVRLSERRLLLKSLLRYRPFVSNSLCQNRENIVFCGRQAFPHAVPDTSAWLYRYSIMICEVAAPSPVDEGGPWPIPSVSRQCGPDCWARGSEESERTRWRPGSRRHPVRSPGVPTRASQAAPNMVKLPMHHAIGEKP